MATRSIYKDVVIKNKTLGRGLVNALEHAKDKKCKEVTMQKQLTNVKKDKIKEIFGN